MADGSSWAGSAPKSVTVALDDGASPDGLSKLGGIHSIEDGTGTDQVPSDGVARGNP